MQISQKGQEIARKIPFFGKKMCLFLQLPNGTSQFPPFQQYFRIRCNVHLPLHVVLMGFQGKLQWQRAPTRQSRLIPAPFASNKSHGINKAFGNGSRLSLLPCKQKTVVDAILQLGFSGMGSREYSSGFQGAQGRLLRFSSGKNLRCCDVQA